ncbi:MAG: hypothetical protein AAGU75_21190 [Bacillota bacterium]
MHRSAKKKENPDIWTFEQYEEYMRKLYGMDYVAGFTEGGVPYGNCVGEDTFVPTSDDSYDEMPF